MKVDLALAVVRQLAAWGVTMIFGVVGDDILPLMDAIARDGRIRYIGAAHEAGAAYMAASWARLSGGLGVCIASAAGAVNLLDGLAGAYLDGVPVLAITGQIKESKIGTPVKQYYNQSKLMANFTVYSEMATDAPGSLRLLILAMKYALTEQSAAHLTFPKDLWTQTVEAEPGLLPALLKSNEVKGFHGDLENVIHLMMQARHPLIVIGPQGNGIRQNIRRLLNHWKAAVVVAQDAKGTVPDDWPEVVGGIGEAWSPKMLQEADCILMIGSASFEENFLPKVVTIQIEKRLSRINDLYLWHSLVGNLQEILTSLTGYLEQYQADLSWWHKITIAKQERKQQGQVDKSLNSEAVHPAQLMSILSDLIDKDAVIALDVGAFMHWFDRDFRAQEQKILLSPVWRSMGNGLPSAIAAKLYFPEKQVVVLIGDGGMLMSLGELETVAKYRVPISIFIINNGLYGLERDKARYKDLHPVGLEIRCPDFSQCARAFGIKGIRIDSPVDIGEKLTEALTTNEPILVDLRSAAEMLTTPG